MKATFYLPAHPSYFHDEYTQAEIEQALKDLDRLQGGIIFKGRVTPPVEWQFVFLREPGKAVTVKVDSSGYRHGSGKLNVQNVRKELDLEEYVQNLSRDLQSFVQSIKTFLHYRRNNPLGEDL